MPVLKIRPLLGVVSMSLLFSCTSGGAPIDVARHEEWTMDDLDGVLSDTALAEVAEFAGALTYTVVEFDGPARAEPARRGEWKGRLLMPDLLAGTPAPYTVEFSNGSQYEAAVLISDSDVYNLLVTETGQVVGKVSFSLDGAAKVIDVDADGVVDVFESVGLDGQHRLIYSSSGRRYVDIMLGGEVAALCRQGDVDLSGMWSSADIPANAAFPHFCDAAAESGSDASGGDTARPGSDTTSLLRERFCAQPGPDRPSWLDLVSDDRPFALNSDLAESFRLQAGVESAVAAVAKTIGSAILGDAVREESGVDAARAVVGAAIMGVAVAIERDAEALDRAAEALERYAAPHDTGPDEDDGGEGGGSTEPPAGESPLGTDGLCELLDRQGGGIPGVDELEKDVPVVDNRCDDPRVNPEDENAPGGELVPESSLTLCNSDPGGGNPVIDPEQWLQSRDTCDSGSDDGSLRCEPAFLRGSPERATAVLWFGIGDVVGIAPCPQEQCDPAPGG